MNIESQGNHLLKYATSDSLKTMLKDKTSIEFTFTHINGQQVKTFGNFDIYDENSNRIIFKRKQAKELLAYLIDKQGYPVTTREIVTEVLEKKETDKTYIKYVSALVGYAIKDLDVAGYTDIIIKEYSIYINKL